VGLVTVILKNQFKKTKAGTIPNEWKVKKIKDISSNVVAGATPSTGNREYWDGDIPWMSSGEINKKVILNTEKRITKQGYKASSTKMIPKNSVLIALAGQGKTRGTVAMNKIELCTNQSLASIIPNDEIDSLYLYYNLDNRYEELRNLSTGDGGRGGLNLRIINNVYVGVPPIKEQHKIASILSIWDKAIELKEKLIEQKKEQKKGLMQKLLTGEVRLPCYEGRWKQFRLGDIGTFLKGKGISKSETLDEGIGCIRYGEIYTVHHFYIKKFYSYINEEIAKKSTKIMKNDILFAGSGETAEEIGKAVAYLGESIAYAGGDIIILRPKIEVDSLFLSYILNFGKVATERAKLGQGNSVVHIYPKSLSTLSFRLPSYEEQCEISRLLKTVDNEINLMEQERNELNDQKKGLMQLLLTGKVRVKV
jgi:type I restriction enzyme, S subunit